MNSNVNQNHDISYSKHVEEELEKFLHVFYALIINMNNAVINNNLKSKPSHDCNLT